MIPCLGVASGLGGSHRGSEKGPIVIRERISLPVDWKEMLCPTPNVQVAWEEIPVLNEKIARITFSHTMQAPFSLIITGDHSSGVGTWSGVAEAQRQKGQELGLIWMDAHMDAHVPETTPSGNIHGMPLAALLGHGAKNLTHLLSEHPKIKPENLFLVGIRCYEDEEKELLEKLNVRIYYIEEVKSRGLSQVLSEIVNTFSERQLSYGVSLDIDFFDPSVMPATGTPEANGVDPDEFLAAYELFDSYPPVAFEFVEFNPPLDTNDESLRRVDTILHRVVQNHASCSVA
ncbi:MAG: arginase [Verrucomicrobia bacterium]|nr:arginase [Verrucomicrobiota bacterium]